MHTFCLLPLIILCGFGAYLVWENFLEYDMNLYVNYRETSCFISASDSLETKTSYITSCFNFYCFGHETCDLMLKNSSKTGYCCYNNSRTCIISSTVNYNLSVNITMLYKEKLINYYHTCECNDILCSTLWLEKYKVNSQFKCYYKIDCGADCEYITEYIDEWKFIFLCVVFVIMICVCIICLLYIVYSIKN